MFAAALLIGCSFVSRLRTPLRPVGVTKVSANGICIGVVPNYLSSRKELCAAPGAAPGASSCGSAVPRSVAGFVFW